MKRRDTHTMLWDPLHSDHQPWPIQWKITIENFPRTNGSTKQGKQSSCKKEGASLRRRRTASMDSRKEERQGGAVAWMTVPTFGDWDMKNGPVPDYSMDFSKIREMRKQNKRELSRASLGGDDDLLAQQHKAAQAQPAKAAFTPAVDEHHRPLHTAHDDSPTGRKKFLSYFQCCIRA